MKKYINIKYWISGWMFVLLGFVNVTFAPTADLTTHQPSASSPNGATFEWDNALRISASNWVASPTAVIPVLYYGVYNFGTCYSEAAPIRVATNISLVATVDLNSLVETTGAPSGMTLTFHKALSVSNANRLSGTAITDSVVVGDGTTLDGKMLTNAGAIAFGPETCITPSEESSIISLGSLSIFVAFTGAEAINNTGYLVYNGNIASGAGASRSLGAATVNGTIFPAGNTPASNSGYRSQNTTATFSIYQGGILIPNYVRKLKCNSNRSNLSLQTVVDVVSG
jgi:hypothetical protein